MYEGNRKTSF